MFQNCTHISQKTCDDIEQNASKRLHQRKIERGCGKSEVVHGRWRGEAKVVTGAPSTVQNDEVYSCYSRTLVIKAIKFGIDLPDLI